MMPYSGANDPDLPPNVKGLPESERRQWVQIFNTSLDRCIMDGDSPDNCEGVAFRNANGVLFGEKVGMFDIAPSQDLYFTINQTAKVERKTVSGKDYLIAPVVAIKTGVLNDELVPDEELASHVSAWNGRPIVIGHPKDLNGRHISANHPKVLAALQAGQLFNAYKDNGSIKGELWIDVEMATRIHRGKEVIDKFENEKPVEVSTAYFRDKVNEAGAFSGQAYTSIARNLKPDHLAILLDVEGACSWQDGCGAPRVNEEGIVSDDLALNPFPNEHAARILSPGQFDEFRRKNDQLGTGIHAIFGIKIEDGERTSEIQAIRFDKTKFTPAQARKWLEDHDFKAIEFEEAEETEAQATNENWIMSTLRSIMRALKVNQEDKMDELVSAIMEDGRLELSEEALRGLDESVLSAIAKLLKAATEREPETEQDNPPQDPATNEGCMPESLKTLVTAIEERGGAEVVLSALDGIRANKDERKAKIIASLAANSAHAFSQEQLEQLSVETLETFEKSLTPADYSGQGGGPVPNVREQSYELPSMWVN